MARGWHKFLVAAACGFVGVSSVRVAKSRSYGRATKMSTKMIGDVPVLNYDKAYQGVPSMAEKGAQEYWVVVASKDASDEQLSNLCQMSSCVRQGHPSKRGMSYFEVFATEAELEQIFKTAGGLIEFAEPDGIVEVIPEMPAPQQSKSWGLDRIGAPLRASSGAGATVFVLDTGIRPTHSDFGGRVIPTLDMSSGSKVECAAGDLRCAGDAQGHGTHCAGTAAGFDYGVAPEASLRTVKVLSDSGSGSWSWSYDALDHLASELRATRPAVASMSLGGQGALSGMRRAVDTAVSSGVVVVVAGGNDNSDACGFSPAFVPSAITVGSTTSLNARSSFSNYGSCTDIWAPGSSITSAAHTSDTGSITQSGTSMACPHVSGASAILLGGGTAPSEVLEKLLAGAVTKALYGLKAGDVNKLLYVGAGGPPPTPVPTVPAFCSADPCTAWYGCWLDKCSVCPKCSS